MPIESTSDGGTMATGDSVYLVHFLAVRSALMLEIRTGMRLSSKGSILTTLQRQGITNKRTRAGALKDLEAYLRTLGWEPTK